MATEIVWEVNIHATVFSELVIGQAFAAADDPSDPPAVRIKVGDGKAVALKTGALSDLVPTAGVIPLRLRVSVWPE